MASAPISAATTAAEGHKLGSLASKILPHILNIYNCKATAGDFDIYATKATFEDPLMRGHGVKQIKSAFYSIPKVWEKIYLTAQSAQVFSEAGIGKYEVKEFESGNGSGEILIDNIQHYKILGRKIDMVSLIKLQIEDGKVVRHEDLWDKKPIWTKESVDFPLIGRVAQSLRRGNMLLTHLLMRFGKDPSP